MEQQRMIADKYFSGEMPWRGEGEVNAKEYLSQVMYIDQRINSKLEQVTRLRGERDELHGHAVGHAQAGFSEQAADGGDAALDCMRSTRTSIGWWI